jgi:hypothetical protein
MALNTPNFRVHSVRGRRGGNLFEYCSSQWLSIIGEGERELPRSGSSTILQKIVIRGIKNIKVILERKATYRHHLTDAQKTGTGESRTKAAKCLKCVLQVLELLHGQIDRQIEHVQGESLQQPERVIKSCSKIIHSTLMKQSLYVTMYTYHISQLGALLFSTPRFTIGLFHETGF